MKKHLIATLPLMAAGVLGVAQAATEADVDNSFNPYKAGMPSFPGLSSGTVINKANVDQFKEVLGTGVYKLIKDGLFEIRSAQRRSSPSTRTTSMRPRPT